MRTRPLTLIVLSAAALSLAAQAAPQKPSLQVSPSQVKMRLGESRQLSARVRGAQGTVRWAVAGPACGAVTPAGFYHAPSAGTTPCTIRVTATVEGDPSLRAETVVFLEAVSVSLKPAKVSLSATGTARFAAQVAGAPDQRVRWSVEGGPANGEINDAGLYSAPANFPTPGTVMVRATSLADPSKSAIATVQIGAVSIQVDPKEVRLQHGRSHRFEAKVKGTSHDDVLWEVVGENQGEISDAGLYTTPSSMVTPSVVTVLARSAADPSKTATARILIDPIQVLNGEEGAAKPRRKTGGFARVARGVYRVAAPRVVRIILPFDPVDVLVRGPRFRGKSGKRYLPLGAGLALDAAVTNTTNDRVRWELEGVRAGELTEDGYYQSPETLTTPQVIQIRATSVADPTKSVLYTLNIPQVLVVAEEKNVTCPLAGAVQLAARVENAENDRIVWSVEGGEQFGTVTETGLYRTPESLPTPGVVRVRAASAADPSKFAMIPVRIPEVSLDVSPESADVRYGESVRLKVRAKGCAGTPDVIWKVTPDLGTVTPDGVYRAPAEGDLQVVQVTAVLRGDPTKTASATLRLKTR